ncbi:hypothetical protein ABZP36_017132 [Zizania latifolia]
MHGWPEVEKRFVWLAVDGILFRSRVGQCIGMVGSEEFVGQIFNALAWVDKNVDGQITEEELKEDSEFFLHFQVLTLTASANKPSKILERVDEYTVLIMEELDPDQLGYNDISNLEALLLLPPSQAPTKLITHSSNISQLISQKLVPTNDRNPIQRGVRKLSYFMEDNWKRVWVMALWLAINAVMSRKDYEKKKELVANEIIKRLENKLFSGLQDSIVLKVGSPKTHRRLLSWNDHTYGPMPRGKPKGLLAMPFNTTEPMLAVEF